jgi:hypothetical protein
MNLGEEEGREGREGRERELIGETVKEQTSRCLDKTK